MHAASDKILFVIATCISTTKYASGQHTFSDYKTIQAPLGRSSAKNTYAATAY
jgi:hypothetical protein